MGNLVDNTLLHNLLVEILNKDKTLMVDVLRTIVEQNPKIIEDLNADKRKRLDKIIDEDFEEYHEVFKALA